MNCTLFCTNHFQPQIYHHMPAARPPLACHTHAAPTPHRCCTTAAPPPHPVFLGIANYPFGKMQYQQVFNVLSTQNKLGACLVLVQRTLHSHSPHVQHSLSACYAHTPCMLSTQSLHPVCNVHAPHTLSPQSPHIFLGIANYPFGKMQYQQVFNELSICE